MFLALAASADTCKMPHLDCYTNLVTPEILAKGLVVRDKWGQVKYNSRKGLLQCFLFFLLLLPLFFLLFFERWAHLYDDVHVLLGLIC